MIPTEWAIPERKRTALISVLRSGGFVVRKPRDYDENHIADTPSGPTLGYIYQERIQIESRGPEREVSRLTRYLTQLRLD